MANKEKDNKKYSIDMLWDNISAQYVEEEDSNTDASHRDKLLKLKVIEHLINVVESVAEESEENKIKGNNNKRTITKIREKPHIIFSLVPRASPRLR